MPQLQQVPAQRRDVSADMEGQQLPWIPTETKERKEEMTATEFLAIMVLLSFSELIAKWLAHRNK